MEHTDPTASDEVIAPYPLLSQSISPAQGHLGAELSGHLADCLGCVSSQGEDSPSEKSPGASQEKHDGLAQIAPDLTVIQFIKGK